METNPQQFPYSNIEEIHSKLKSFVEKLNNEGGSNNGNNRSVETAFGEFDRDKNGWISVEEFKSVLERLGFQLMEQVWIHIFRLFYILLFA